MNEGLNVQELSHSYGNKKALDNVSFNISKGTFCALLGPNGAGKSTLFALLTRLFTPSTGNINIMDVDLLKNPSDALAKIGIVFQQPTFDMDLTVQQNLNYAAALHGLSGKAGLEAINTSLEQLGMQHRAGEKVRSLNGGHRRRMEIARALLHQPNILLLDEATVGLDAETRHMITSYAHKITKERDTIVLWATHLVDEVMLDDQLLILHQGKIIKDGLCKELIGDKTLAETFATLTGSRTI